jgi:probable F420-dependent oxidoreductase
MRIGVTANFGMYGTNLAEVARTIERLGFESVWTGEHIFMPAEIANPVRNGVPMPEFYKNMPALFVTLGVIAGATRHLRLGTSVCLVPQRHPLALAKEVASLDFISGGRVVLGIGNGWVEEEGPIMGYDFKDRVRRTNEFLEAMKLIWTEERASFSGEFVSFPAILSNPKPVQKPWPPILIGAGDTNIDNSRILRRIAERADGWLPLNLTPPQMRDQLGQLRELCEARGRDFAAMDISLMIASSAFGIDTANPSTAGSSGQAIELAQRYAEAGVTRIVVLPLGLGSMRDPHPPALEAIAKAFRLEERTEGAAS